MSRNWDKLRRQDKARRQNPVESFRTGRQKRRASRFRASVPRREPPSAPPNLSMRSVALRVELPDCIAGAVFKRINGNWRCIKAAPVIEWMSKVRNLDLIYSWLRKNNFLYQWVKPTTGLEASQVSPEEHPAEAHTLNQASHSPEVNSVPSLNNNTNADHPGPSPGTSALLEQNGVTMPRCLMRSERSEQSQTGSIAST